jgi:hypothetical protein
MSHSRSDVGQCRASDGANFGSVCSYFNRGPDPAGLAYWFKSVYTGEYSLRTIAERFTFEQEYLDAYPGALANREFIDKIYLNLFDRGPDAGGWDYWTEQLDSGARPRSGFILDVIEGAYAPTSGPEDRTLIDNKHDVSLYYSGLLSLQPGLRRHCRGAQSRQWQASRWPS